MHASLVYVFVYGMTCPLYTNIIAQIGKHGVVEPLSQARRTLFIYLSQYVYVYKIGTSPPSPLRHFMLYICLSLYVHKAQRGVEKKIQVSIFFFNFFYLKIDMIHLSTKVPLSFSVVFDLIENFSAIKSFFDPLFQIKYLVFTFKIIPLDYPS